MITMKHNSLEIHSKVEGSTTVNTIIVLNLIQNLQDMNNI